LCLNSLTVIISPATSQTDFVTISPHFYPARIMQWYDLAGFTWVLPKTATQTASSLLLPMHLGRHLQP
jgi:hypothetical protein